MTNSAIVSANDIWRFATTSADLSITPLRGEVALNNPALGISRLTWHNTPIAGHVLGVAAGPTSIPQDSFARESDLVAVYAQAEPHTFSWQVYWRVTAPLADAVLVDVILSLQTPLLESFPQVTTSTLLPAGEAVTIAGEGDCVVLRPADCSWSYAEMTHPKDRGELQVVCATENQLHRGLGGQFLEKGVIRRLRLRGAFLPRDNDVDLAKRYCALLAAETPPLTA